MARFFNVFNRILRKKRAKTIKYLRKSAKKYGKSYVKVFKM